MADRKLINNYENSVMDLAVSEMLEQYGRELEEKYRDVPDVSPSPEAAANFESELDRAYKRGQLRSFRQKLTKIGRYAVTVCAVFIIILTVSVISVDALRFRFLEWLIDIHESHSSLNISKDDKSYSDMIHVDYVPPKYKMKNYIYDGDLVEICYENDTSYVKIQVYLNDYNDFTFNSDNENILSEEIYINENRGQYQKKTSTSTIFWYSGENSYCISTNDMQISKDEFIKIAQSVN